jgi:hypothetical protein
LRGADVSDAARLQDWDNPRRFVAHRHRADHAALCRLPREFPETVRIILNHVDMAHPGTAYWRGRPALYKTCVRPQQVGAFPQRLGVMI